jgi:mannosyltransferase OCH1-like enzyme
MKSKNNFKPFFILFISLTLLFIIFYFIFSNKSIFLVETFDNPIQETVIPLNFYQTWINGDKEIPPNMKQTMDTIQQQNPEFNYKCFNETECREFIKNNFTDDVLNTFDKLIPGAYKADLWRYCVLYINGGMYLDAKMKPADRFRFISLTDKEYFVRDIDFSGTGIWNGFIVCKPNNPIMLKGINGIVKNVKENYYGNSCLSPTGPLLLKTFFTEDEINNLPYELSFDGDIMIIKDKNNNVILTKDETVSKEQLTNKHYSVLWNERKIYNDSIE